MVQTYVGRQDGSGVHLPWVCRPGSGMTTCVASVSVIVQGRLYGLSKPISG